MLLIGNIGGSSHSRRKSEADAPRLFVAAKAEAFLFSRSFAII
jgi:hypothetical protein